MDDEVDQMLATLEEGFPAVHEMTGPQVRAVMASRQQPVTNVDDVSGTEDLVFGDENPVPVRVYRPHGGEGRVLPAVVFCHGGGFVFCNIESHDGFCRMLARNTGSVVVSVGYRLAPEHRAPAAAQDAFTVLRHVARHADTLGVDPDRVVVAGDSSGGNLAATASLMARDNGGPAIAGQVLLYPVIEPDFETESYRRFATGHFNTRAAMEWYWRQYLGDDPIPEPVEYVVPIRAESLADLPPAVVVTAGRDPLCTEGERYAAALDAAGVTVRHRHYPELFHGFITIGPFGPAASAREILWRDVLGLLPGHAPLERSTHG